MQMQYSYRAIDKEFHEPWQRALGNVIEHALKPLLDKHTKDSAQLQIVLDRDKIKRQFLASGYMHLPGKKIVSVTASHDELTPLAQMLAQSLFRQAKKHFDRLHAQDQIKRKARRERLRELKVRIAAKPASAAHEAKETRMLYCRNLRLSQGVSWLICGPSAIYRAIIRRCATWWMKRLSELRWNGNPCRGKKRLTPVF